MDADTNGGVLTTRPVKFSGKHLFVNLATADGELRVEMLDEEGTVIEPFTKENCEPLRVDAVTQKVRWKNADLSLLTGKPVRFRFHLNNGSLYSFWVSPTETGLSNGYVAAGGPGFDGPTDTIGNSTP